MNAEARPCQAPHSKGLYSYYAGLVGEPEGWVRVLHCYPVHRCRRLDRFRHRHRSRGFCQVQRVILSALAQDLGKSWNMSLLATFSNVRYLNIGERFGDSAIWALNKFQ